MKLKGLLSVTALVMVAERSILSTMVAPLMSGSPKAVKLSCLLFLRARKERTWSGWPMQQRVVKQTVVVKIYLRALAQSKAAISKFDSNYSGTLYRIQITLTHY